jgi:hypothetical protein
MSQATKGFAVITGASSGIGAVYVDRLAKRGYDLILVARRFDRLRRLADKIADETSREVEVIAADLVKRKDLANVETVLRTDKRITTLVNDAGVASTAPLLQADVENMSEVIALNVDWHPSGPRWRNLEAATSRRSGREAPRVFATMRRS